MMQSTMTTIERSFVTGVSISLGGAITGILFLIMCALIANRYPDVIDEPPVKLDPVVMEKPKIVPIVNKPPVRPVEPIEQPLFEPLPQTFDHDLKFASNTAPQLIGERLAMDKSVSSGTAIAIMRVAPNYPVRAQQRGVEGYVDLMFDVNASGKTENIRVVNADPKGYFEKESIKTLSRWKYKPAMVDGVAMPQKNQLTRITFSLDN